MLLSGIRIENKLVKNKLVRIYDMRDKSCLIGVLGYKAVKLLIKYLGLSARFKEERTWDPVVELFERRLVKWKTNFLSKGGRLALVKSTLASLPIYFLSILMVSIKIGKKN